MSLLVELRKNIIFFFLILVIAGIFSYFNYYRQPVIRPLRIGVLFSLTGSQAFKEKHLIDAVRLAVQELNKKRDTLGSALVEMIIVDGQSDPAIFAQEAERLIVDEKVNALFGCMNSLCLEAVRPVVEKYQHLLFFSAAYEGLQQSPHIIYLGSVPNQQVSPGIRWAIENLGKKAYFVGTKQRRSLMSHQLARDLMNAWDGKVLKETFFEDQVKDFKSLVAEIKKNPPQFIFNTLQGENNFFFFKALEEAGLHKIPVISMDLNKQEILSYKAHRLKNHYSLSHYFQGLHSETNHRFIDGFKELLGHEPVLNDAMESTYIGIHFWAETVKQRQSADPLQVNTETLLRQTFAGPSGIAAIDATTRHAWKMARVLKIDEEGHLKSVYDSPFPLKPAPWPIFRSRESWIQILKKDELRMGMVK